MNTAGILYGLCSGFGYALYSIFARLAIDRGYDSRTINFYACLLAAAGAVIIWGGAEVPLMFQSASSVLWSLGTGIVSCYLPYLLYTYGLSGVETGKAAVMASVEPVVATIVGIAAFGEGLSGQNVLGVLLVLGAIVLINFKNRNLVKK
jgi:DME family drug/metabolite transporter